MKTNFLFKGNRKYVHGPDMYQALVSHLLDTCKDDFLSEQAIIVQNFKIFRELTGQGEIVIGTPDEIQELKVDRIICKAIVCVGNRELGGALLETSTIIKGNKDEKSLVQSLTLQGDFSGCGTIGPISSSYDLVEGMIQLNKVCHEATLGELAQTYKYRWAYLKNFPHHQNDLGLLSVGVEIDNVHVKKNERKNFTASEIRFSDVNAETVSRLCFAYFN